MTPCLFCKIASHEIPAQVIYEDNEMIAFKDIQPQAPVHLLWIPKKHLAGIDEIHSEDSDLIGRMILKMKEYAEKELLQNQGYRIVSNIGQNGRQSIRHLHFHLLAGRELSEFLG